MKSLHELTNTERGKILADLFPGQIEYIVEAMLLKAAYLKEHQQEIGANWKNALFTFDSWLGLSEEATKIINKYRFSIIRSSKVFSDQLFYGYTAMFTVDCIVKYAREKKSDTKFQKAVDLLFNI